MRGHQCDRPLDFHAIHKSSGRTWLKYTESTDLCVECVRRALYGHWVSVSRDIGVHGTLFGFLLYFYGNSIRAPMSVFCFVFSVSVSNRTKAKLRMTLGTVGHEWVKNDSEPAKIFSDIGHLDIFCTPYFQDSLEIAVL